MDHSFVRCISTNESVSQKSVSVSSSAQICVVTSNVYYIGFIYKKNHDH